MFTGIIQYTANVSEVKGSNKSLFVTFTKPKKLTLTEGCSVAVNGVCSTVRDFTSEQWTVQFMPETLRLTTLNMLEVGNEVNIEPTLRLGDELSGHMVQGHVDGIGEVAEIVEEGQSWEMTFKASKKIMDLVVYKGSIAIDGISLTISALDDEKESFSVSLIEHTIKNTNLKDKKVGSHVNFEVDIIGKYLKKFTKTQ